MKNKYVMIGGFAFSEESDMKKLENYASKGWILEDIVWGFFYKLKKDKPQNIVYSLDYQKDANEEYFSIFKEAGWNLVSAGGGMYIFSAPAGTKPIYSDSESEIDKYISARSSTKKGSICSLIVSLPLIGLLFTSAVHFKFIFPIILGLLIIDIIIFIFNFMPYLAYNSRIKEMKKTGKCKYEKVSNKIEAIVFGVIGIAFLFPGIKFLIQKRYLGLFYIILGLFEISVSFSCYKNYKKHS